MILDYLEKRVSKFKRKLKFEARIVTNSKKEIIKELYWFIKQLELDADGGGSDDSKISSHWEVKECSLKTHP